MSVVLICVEKWGLLCLCVEKGGLLYLCVGEVLIVVPMFRFLYGEFEQWNDVIVVDQWNDVIFVEQWKDVIVGGSVEGCYCWWISERMLLLWISGRM